MTERNKIFDNLKDYDDTIVFVFDRKPASTVEEQEKFYKSELERMGIPTAFKRDYVNPNKVTEKELRKLPWGYTNIITNYDNQETSTFVHFAMGVAGNALITDRDIKFFIMTDGKQPEVWDREKVVDYFEEQAGFQFQGNSLFSIVTPRRPRSVTETAKNSLFGEKPQVVNQLLHCEITDYIIQPEYNYVSEPKYYIVDSLNRFKKRGVLKKVLTKLTLTGSILTALDLNSGYYEGNGWCESYLKSVKYYWGMENRLFDFPGQWHSILYPRQMGEIVKNMKRIDNTLMCHSPLVKPDKTSFRFNF